MNHIEFLKTILAVTLLSACVPSVPVSQATKPAGTETVIVQMPVAMDAAVSTPSPAIINIQAPTATFETREPVIGDTTVKASLSDEYGLSLVTDNGFFLYVYKKDKQNGESSACSEEECKSDWSPLTTEGAPIAGTGVIQELLGTITRDDGRRQITYNGWPLYLYNGDTTGGASKEHGRDDEWFLISPSGDAISK